MDPIAYLNLARTAFEDLDNDRFSDLSIKVNKYGPLFLSSLINESIATNDKILAFKRVQKCLKFDNGNLKPFEDKHFEMAQDQDLHNQYFIEQAFNQENLECAKLLIKHKAKTDFKAQLREDFSRHKRVQKLNKFIEEAKIGIIHDNMMLILAHKHDINSTFHKIPRDVITTILLQYI